MRHITGDSTGGFNGSKYDFQPGRCVTNLSGKCHVTEEQSLNRRTGESPALSCCGGSWDNDGHSSLKIRIFSFLLLLVPKSIWPWLYGWDSYKSWPCRNQGKNHPAHWKHMDPVRLESWATACSAGSTSLCASERMILQQRDGKWCLSHAKWSASLEKAGQTEKGVRSSCLRIMLWMWQYPRKKTTGRLGKCYRAEKSHAVTNFFF